jgi:hypothetical protein
MAAKEKAKELYLKMLHWQVEMNTCIENDIISTSAQECALIAINEMIDMRNGLYLNEGSIVHQYLLDVKQEILKL